jgi:polysaccharide deacetylase family protein (PEP-CTERM system associated)
VLEDVAGREVKGYRAPSFSIGPANFWAFDCIAEAGYRYSSSIYPIRHDLYGAPDPPRFPYNVRENLLECRSQRFGCGIRTAAGGGGYFRLPPYRIQWSISHVNAVDRRPAMFYFHPWSSIRRSRGSRGPAPKRAFATI